MKPPILKTARLILRPFSLADAPAVQRLAGAFAVADTTLNIPHPYPEGLAEQWIASQDETYAQGMGINWAVVLQERGELCGSVSLGLHPTSNNAEMGYWFGHAYWGHGYATEAGSCVVEYCFSQLNLHRVYARHFARNPASGRVLQKVGMRDEGCQREHVRRGDQYEDVRNYGLLNKEWRASE